MTLAVIPPREAAILIVDDAPASLDVLRVMMSQQGYQTFVATSGQRALALAQRMRPDLILLDVVMPGMDGLETCRQLKLNPGTQDIPVIFMSALHGTDDVVAGFNNGAVDYIGKPLRMAEVCARVRTQLQMRATTGSHLEQAYRLRLVVDSMSEGLMIIGDNGAIQYSNPACDAYLGYEAGELAEHAITDLLGESEARACIDYLAACGSDLPSAARQEPREVMLRHSDGIPRAMELALTPMRVANERLLIGLIRDISHRKQYETSLENAAMSDPLTRLANRRRLDNFLEQEWQRAVRSNAPLSMVMLDVDYFKLYNDTLGHAAGDQALQAVAGVLSAHALRPTDLAARHGGEEFVVVFAETDAVSALLMAESIRAGIQALGLVHPRSPSAPSVTVSVGVATVVPSQNEELSRFFVMADMAMYAAKEAGRNRVVAVGANG
jgi:diguanylate cyclase (GGDEF)-like protein/PAS domain S-box-containing protein